ncbi:hypothetical protein [Streptomyces sp. NPDC004435]|uniref:hypothetical protein n=1 Tax=Streptomyces sp. NPDC004435 TaxID=3364701 RepID=UPI0036C3767A
MSPLPLTHTTARARGVGRGLGASAVATLTVLLPMAGHLLTQGHLAPWALLAALLVGPAAGGYVLSRRRLSDPQLLAALVGAQLAHQLAYAVPGVCALAGLPGGGADAVAGHVSAAGAPPEAFLAGHLITFVLAVRLLGLPERLRWHTEPVLAGVAAVLSFLWPLLIVRGTGPAPVRRPADVRLPHSALVPQPVNGRAPPCAPRGPLGHASRHDRAENRPSLPYALAA